MKELSVLPANEARVEALMTTTACIVGKVTKQKKYSITELLAISDYSYSIPQEEREWVNAFSVGGEL